MMKVFHWLDEYLEAGFAALLLAVIVGLISVQVFMRYVMQHSLSWSEELTLWIFVWFIWLATSYAFKRRMHVKVALFHQMLSPKNQLVLDIMTQVLIMGFMLVLIYQCVTLMNMPFVARQTSVVLGMPIQYFYASAPVGASLSLLRLGQNLIADIRAIRVLQNPQSINNSGQSGN